MMFGIWKMRARSEVTDWNDDEDLLMKLTGIFTSIDAETARKLCQHPKKEVWRKLH